MKDIIGNFWTFILALAVLPFVYGLGMGFLKSLEAVKTAQPASPSLIYFLCGLISYAIFQVIFSNPVKIYIFGHELTHALAGILSGGKVKSFKAGKSGGSVTLTKAGLFATLAPYFLPVYTLILLIIYAAINLVFGENAVQVFPYFMFLFGASIAFHLSLTVYAISRGQPDLKRYGIFYSLIIVLIFNILVLESIFAVFFKAPVSIFFNDLLKYTGNGYISIYDFGVKLKCQALQTIIRK